MAAGGALAACGGGDDDDDDVVQIDSGPVGPTATALFEPPAGGAVAE